MLTLQPDQMSRMSVCGLSMMPCPVSSLCSDIKSLGDRDLEQRVAAEQVLVEKLAQMDPAKAASLQQIRHDRDMGLLANAPYATKNDESPVLPYGYSEVPKDQLKQLGLNPGDLSPDLKVYTSTGQNGEPHYVLSCRGTETGSGLRTAASDIGTDVAQAIGLETDAYKRAIEAAKRMPGKGNLSIELTGHSKGGGQAAAASMATGIPATTFNAAGVHEDTLARMNVPGAATNAGEKIRAYFNERDPLNGAQDNRTKVLLGIGSAAAFMGGIFGAGLVAMLGSDGALPKAQGKRIPVKPARDQGSGPLEGHSMNTMVTAMNEQIESQLEQACGC